MNSQKRTADSLLQVLQTDMPDTDRAKNIRNLSNAIYKYNPDSAMRVAYAGLKYAKEIKYKGGISRIYEMIAIILTKTGNFNRALSYYIENLKIEESLKSQDGIICANINIGIVYVYMLDYEKALQSYAKAHALLQTFATKDTAYLEDLKYSTNLNIGDAFDKMHQVDSAFVYYNNALNIAIGKKNNYKKGLALLGIANLYAATKEYSLSMANYQTSLRLLSESNDEELACDACLGIAKLYQHFQKTDSALSYARQGLFFAKKNNFLSKQLDLSNFLNEIFAANHNIDSAYFYITSATNLRDSILSNEKMRITQQMTFDENLRQLELLEKQRQEREERRQQLQHIFIGLLIPTLFVITILLARIRIKVKLLKFLGVISLLFLFEYLTLLLHPIVQNITHHTPVLEILIFVAIAALIIPTHHKIEHWLIERLIRKVQGNQDEPLTKEIGTLHEDLAMQNKQKDPGQAKSFKRSDTPSK